MYTVLSEIIFKENKIVIDYDFEGLVVLGVINIDTGRELSRDDLKPYCRAMGLNLVQEYKKSLSDALKENEKNREGYVLTYPSTGIKVKVKFEEYVRLHKILTGLNVHSVWELLRDGKSATIDEWIADARMPETFKAWVFGVRRELCISLLKSIISL
jgi:RNA ligase